MELMLIQRKKELNLKSNSRGQSYQNYCKVIKKIFKKVSKNTKIK